MHHKYIQFTNNMVSICEAVTVCLYVPVCSRGSQLDVLEIVCFRDRTLQGSRSVQHSLVLEVKLPSLTPLSAGNFPSLLEHPRLTAHMVHT